MTISEVISSIQTNLDNAYAALSSKGAAIPTNKNIENLSVAINSIVTSPAISNVSATATINYRKYYTEYNTYTKVVVKCTWDANSSAIGSMTGVLNISVGYTVITDTWNNTASKVWTDSVSLTNSQLKSGSYTYTWYGNSYDAADTAASISSSNASITLSG